MKFLILPVLTAALALAPVAVSAHDAAHHNMQMDMGGEPSGVSLANLESPWTTADGKATTLASLTGEPAVVSMGYTSCKDMCPAIVADMMWIEKHLPDSARGKVRFAFFSIDSANDTPARLKAYADEHGFDSNWTLYHGDEDSVRELAAVLGVAFKPDGQGGFDHAAVVTLLDPKGEIVFQQRGVKASSEDLLDKLKALTAK